MTALVATLLAVVLSEPPRAARSVHLSYIADECDVFYTEMTVVHSTRGSYFCACGFVGGYFGIQELGDGKKIAIFSVWDPTKGDEPSNVPADERVEVVDRNRRAIVKRFGGEGTGAQCLIDFKWNERQTVCFLVRARIDGERTVYSAYIRARTLKDWIHLATFATRNNGKRLTGMYSFIEDFRRDKKSADETRMARFANGWVKSKDDWIPLTKARFTASQAEWEAKDTIDAGVDATAFFLQTGGDTKQQTELGDTIVRTPPADDAPPEHRAAK